MCSLDMWFRNLVGGTSHGFRLLRLGTSIFYAGMMQAHWHGQGWLSLQRVADFGFNESRTRTRACMMRVHKRWEESLAHVKQISL